MQRATLPRFRVEVKELPQPKVAVKLKTPLFSLAGREVKRENAFSMITNVLKVGVSEAKNLIAIARKLNLL